MLLTVAAAFGIVTLAAFATAWNTLGKIVCIYLINDSKLIPSIFIK